MWLVKCLPILAFMVLPMVEVASASDELYRCADGTFTNRVERQCPTYESKGIVRVQAGIAEASKQPSAEVKIFNESVKRRGAGR